MPVPRLLAAALLAGTLAGASPATGQSLPDGVSALPFRCPPPDPAPEAVADSEAERAERARRARYREVLPAFLAALPGPPDAELLMPVAGVRVAQVSDTWGAARANGRSHEGQDIFAPRGTPVRSATDGYVYRVGENRLGGNSVVVVGSGGRRYYYAHLDGFAAIREGQWVTRGTELGYVGTSGNAAGTPPHLHFGVYESREDACSWDALNPHPLLRDN